MMSMPTGRALDRRWLLGAGAAALCAWPLGAKAHSYRRGGLFIGHLWSPPGGPDLPVFGPLLNSSATDDALIAAHCPSATNVRFEAASSAGAGALREIALLAGKPVTLAAWGARIVLVGLAAPAKAGMAIPLTLVFRNAGSFEVTTMVENAPDH